MIVILNEDYYFRVPADGSENLTIKLEMTRFQITLKFWVLVYNLVILIFVSLQTGPKTFSYRITRLEPGERFSIRALASNSEGYRDGETRHYYHSHSLHFDNYKRYLYIFYENELLMTFSFTT